MCLFLDCGGGGIDLVFAVPNHSGSITASGFDLIKELVANITSTLDIGLQKSLAGVIIFNDAASVEFGVTRHTDKANLLTAINNLNRNTINRFKR